MFESFNGRDAGLNWLDREIFYTRSDSPDLDRTVAAGVRDRAAPQCTGLPPTGAVC